jgi:hypothetical protein
MKVWPLSVVLLLVSTSPLSSQNVTVTDASPPEAKLAAIDRNTRVIPRAVIQEYARLLDRAEPRCTQSRMRIADMIVAGTRELLSRYRKIFTNLQFLRAFDRMMVGYESEAGRREQDCAPLIALLVMTLGEA